MRLDGEDEDDDQQKTRILVVSVGERGGQYDSGIRRSKSFIPSFSLSLLFTL